MADHTTWRVGATAKNLIIVENDIDVQAVLGKYPDAYILGNGSNILVAADIDVVVKLGPRFKASQHVHALCNSYARSGRSGLEFLMGIPASLGGAIKMNAGGRFGSMDGVVKTVTVYHDEEIKTVEPKFRYRGSDIQGLILDADLRTDRSFPECITNRMREIILEKKKHQPLGANSAGCTFKNPNGAIAAKLIDDLELKGKKFGGVYVSEMHANFIIAERDAPPQDVLDAIAYIKKFVFEETGYQLETEIEIWPRNYQG
jgi:UDP-N-acetylmuramate dehydrogenase